MVLLVGAQQFYSFLTIACPLKHLTKINIIFVFQTVIKLCMYMPLVGDLIKPCRSTYELKETYDN